MSPQNSFMIFAWVFASVVGVSVMSFLSVMSGVLEDGMRWDTLSVTFLCFFLVEVKYVVPYDLSSLFLSLLSIAGLVSLNCSAIYFLSGLGSDVGVGASCCSSGNLSRRSEVEPHMVSVLVSVLSILRAAVSLSTVLMMAALFDLSLCLKILYACFAVFLNSFDAWKLSRMLTFTLSQRFLKVSW